MKSFIFITLIIQCKLILSSNYPDYNDDADNYYNCACNPTIFIDYRESYKCSVINEEIINEKLQKCRSNGYYFDINSIISINFINSSIKSSFGLGSYSNLKELFLNNCSLVDFNRNLLKQGKNLINLNITSCNIKILPNLVFGDLNNLNILDLSYNLINEIGVLYGPSKLTYLNLANNKIQKLSENAFSGLENLQIIYLNNNEIDIIDENTFAHNNILKSVDLSFNKIYLFDNVQLPKSLSSLIMNNNFVKSLHVSKYLTILNVANNMINNIQFENSSSLIHLNLSRNSLTNISNEVSQFKNLISLDLSFNFVGKLNISTFKDLRNLETLHLKNTSLSGLNYGIFSMLGKLRFLDISYNHLMVIDFNHFLPLPQIEKIFIDGNDLVEIDSLIPILSSLDSLGLSNNNFNCSYLSKLVNSLSSRKINILVDESNLVHHLPNINGIPCNVSKSDTEKFSIKYPQNILTNSVIPYSALDNEKIIQNTITDLSNKIIYIESLHEKLTNDSNSNYMEILQRIEVIANKQINLENQIMNIKSSILQSNLNNISSDILEERNNSLINAMNSLENERFQYLSTKIEEIYYKLNVNSVELAKLKLQVKSNDIPSEKINQHEVAYLKNGNESSSDIQTIKTIMLITFFFGVLFIIYKLIIFVANKKYKASLNMLLHQNNNVSSTTLNTVTTSH